MPIKMHNIKYGNILLHCTYLHLHSYTQWDQVKPSYFDIIIQYLCTFCNVFNFLVHLETFYFYNLTKKILFCCALKIFFAPCKFEHEKLCLPFLNVLLYNYKFFQAGADCGGGNEREKSTGRVSCRMAEMERIYEYTSAVTRQAWWKKNQKFYRKL